MIIIFAVVVLFLIASIINHRVQLRKEARKYPPPGKMIKVNGKKMHVYAEGQGDMVLVFLAGHGTSNPTLDFKPLWKRFVDKYRIVVVEKSGYGWSEVSNSPRDIKTILADTRKALTLSGESGPFVLIPHSMSGLEAIYWAQKYPEEVKAIIGLDPCTPGAINVLPEPQKLQLVFMFLISRIGLSRLMPDSEVKENFPLLKSGELTGEDRENYLAAFYKSAFSRDMLREIKCLKYNAEEVAKNGVPEDTPMFFFISNDQEIRTTGWKKELTEFLKNLNMGHFLDLDTGHYVHYDKAELIAEEARIFLKNIEKR